MGKIAFVFAGQGAQSVGMGKDLYENSPAAKAVFDMAESKRPGLLSLCFDGPAEALNVTRNTQPCLFAMDLAAAAALGESGVRSDGAAGFSLGEIPALGYCGIMTEEDAFDLVCFRAESMQKCAEENEGAMAAVLKLSVEQIKRICSEIEHAYPVNYNCPGQTVVSFALDSEEALKEAVAKNGGRYVKLAVSGAFHSPFMDDASITIFEYLSKRSFCEPSIPLYANLTARIYDEYPAHLIADQVNHPVRWQQTVEQMVADGFDTFIEVGAGKTLSGLIKKINPEVSIFNVSDMALLNNTIEGLQHA